MACPLPDVRRPAPGRRGAKLGEEPKGGPFHPGGHRLGKIGRANTREPLVDASLSANLVDGTCGGVQGHAVAKRQTPAGKWPRPG